MSTVINNTIDTSDAPYTLIYLDESYTIEEFKAKFNSKAIRVNKATSKKGKVYHIFHAGAQTGWVSSKILEGDERTPVITRCVDTEKNKELWMLHPKHEEGETVMEF